jgi:PAS domain S-box-containing protein
MDLWDFVRNAPVGVVITNHVGLITYHNQCYADMLQLASTVGEYFYTHCVEPTAARYAILGESPPDEALVDEVPVGTMTLVTSQHTLMYTRYHAMKNDNGVYICYENITDYEIAKRRIQYTRSGLLDGYWEWDVIRNVEYYSPQFWSVLGYDPESKKSECRPEAWQELIHPDDLASIFQVFQEHCDTHGKSPYYNEVRYIHQESKEITWVICKGHVVEWTVDQRPHIMLGTHTDITEQKTREQRQKMNCRIQKDFISMFSHEVRTPLNGIMGSIECLQKTELNMDQMELVSNLKECVEDIMPLLDDVLAMTRLETQKTLQPSYSACDPHELLQELQRLHQRTLDHKTLQIHISKTIHVPDILWLDRARVKQILQNLLSNSIRFTPNHGYIIFEIDYKVPMLIYTVRDSGCGMPPHVIKTLFTPYFTRGGTGIGLATCKKIAKTLGGDIKLLHSEEGKGCSFQITMKAKEVKKEDSPTTPPRSISPIQTHAKIMVVDDNKINRRLIVRQLREIGICDEAENGHEAVQMHDDHPSDFAIIIMDCLMPVMDGWEACRAIRKKDTTIPILALTADISEDTANKCRLAGMNEVLHKPIPQRKLQKKVLQYCHVFTDLRDESK